MLFGATVADPPNPGSSTTVTRQSGHNALIRSAAQEAAMIGLARKTRCGPLPVRQTRIWPRGVVMEGPVFISPDFQQDILDNYFIDLTPDAWGLHLIKVWNWRRDLFMYWPWYRVARENARDIGIPRAKDLHLYAIGILESGTTYDGAYRAAFSYDTRSRLPKLTRPGLVCAGPNDMLKDGLVDAREIGPKDIVTVCETPTTVWWPDPDPKAAAETLALYDRFLRGTG